MALRSVNIPPVAGREPLLRTAGRGCETCRHRESKAIGLALLAGEPLRSIAERYDLSHSSVARHKLKCVPSDLMQARAAKKFAEADFLLAKACSLDREAEAVCQRALAKGDSRSAISAISERRRIVALQLGVSRAATPASSRGDHLDSFNYDRLRSRILHALEAHPEARDAVAKALARPSVAVLRRPSNGARPDAPDGARGT